MVAAMSNSASLALHALGLIVIYSGYSLYQEKIMKSSYGPDQVRFTSSAILVLCNRLFSMMVGLGLIAYKAARSDASDFARASFRARIRPRSPIFAYAAVAACNFAATFCQYEALRHVGFTTQALAKCCKMAPVLFVGRIVYKRKHNAKSWVAASVVAFGCAVYLFSSTPESAKTSASGVTFLDGLMGTVLILGYLFFDGLTSTTQERVFGRAPSSTDPFGPDSPVLDQMIFVNLFAILISLVASAATIATTLLPSIALILSSPTLALDILGLSATSACGLIVLLNTISAFGALTSSTIMTVRQFLSILVNAGVFGSASSVGTQGWTGIFWVAGGIFIKMDRRWDEPKAPKRPVFVADEEETPLFDAEKALSAESSPTRAAPGTPLPPYEPIASNVSAPPARRPSPLRQFGPPLAIPLLLGIITGVVTGDVPKLPSLPSLAGVQLYEPEVLEAAVEEPVDGADVDVDSVALENTVAVVEGGQWSKQLHSAVDPSCPDMVQTKAFKGKIARTALATFPRSGNSYIRSMFERATGYQTSSMYCDRVLELAFKGECDHKANFLVKTHYPAVRTFPNNTPSHWADFDRVLHVVRNPLDAIYSYHMWRTHHHDHEHKEDASRPLGSTHGETSAILLLARRYRDHAQYWSTVPLLTHELRYEDLRATPLPVLMDSLAFILPAEELPTLERLACALELNENAQAYHSAKRSTFAAWDRYTPELRNEILEITSAAFCRFGYATMAAEEGLHTGIDCRKLKSNPRA